jgi:hypothetical protein
MFAPAPIDKSIDIYDLEDLAMYILGIDPNCDDYEQKIETALYNSYGIEDPDAFYQLIRQLVPLIDKSKSGISDTTYKGFAAVERSNEDGSQLKRWILKIPA